MNLSELANSYGLGVRLDTPLGLLRLDYGWGKNEENQRKGQFYFGTWSNVLSRNVEPAGYWKTVHLLVFFTFVAVRLPLL
jgi:hypothetical protein